MRLGCSGCLTVLLALLLAAGGVAGSVWVTIRLVDTPSLDHPGWTPADSAGAQDKLARLLRPSGRREPRPVSVTLSEREVSAFLARHLGPATDLALADVAVDLPEPGMAVVAGQLPLRTLLGQTPLAGLAQRVPGWVDRPVWVVVEARPRLESGGRGQRRYLRLEVERLYVGRQRLPAVLLRLLLEPPALNVLRWPVPPAIEALSVEPGRVVLRGTW